jgi:hypothetical protein
MLQNKIWMLHIHARCMQVYVSSVSYVCCKCFIWVLHMFVMVFKCFQTLVLSVLSVFFCILQLLHLDISKVDRVLHIGCPCEAASDMGNIRGSMGDVQGGAGPLLGHSLVRCTSTVRTLASRIGRALASPFKG